jgi:hypothetical protein
MTEDRGRGVKVDSIVELGHAFTAGDGISDDVLNQAVMEYLAAGEDGAALLQGTFFLTMCAFKAEGVDMTQTLLNADVDAALSGKD